MLDVRCWTFIGFPALKPFSALRKNIISVQLDETASGRFKRWTSNIERPTSNEKKRSMSNNRTAFFLELIPVSSFLPIQNSMLDVRCSMFIFSQDPRPFVLPGARNHRRQHIMYFVQQCASSDALRENAIVSAVFARAFYKVTDFEVEYFCIFSLQYNSPGFAEFRIQETGVRIRNGAHCLLSSAYYLLLTAYYLLYSVSCLYTYYTPPFWPAF